MCAHLDELSALMDTIALMGKHNAIGDTLALSK
jgi:hypothetical protein